MFQPKTHESFRQALRHAVSFLSISVFDCCQNPATTAPVNVYGVGKDIDPHVPLLWMTADGCQQFWCCLCVWMKCIIMAFTVFDAQCCIWGSPPGVRVLLCSGCTPLARASTEGQAVVTNGCPWLSTHWISVMPKIWPAVHRMTFMEACGDPQSSPLTTDH